MLDVFHDFIHVECPWNEHLVHICIIAEETCQGQRGFQVQTHEHWGVASLTEVS